MPLYQLSINTISFYSLLYFVTLLLNTVNISTSEAFAAPPDNANENAQRNRERNAEKRLEKRAERQIAKGLSKNIDKKIEKQVAASVEKSAEKNAKSMGAIMSNPETRAEVLATQGKATAPGQQVSTEAKNKNKHASTTKAETFFNPHALIKEDNGFYRIQKQWLILADEKTVDALTQKGFRVINSSPLRSIKKVLIEIEEPANITLSQMKQAEFQILKKAPLDFNHLFEQQKGTTKTTPSKSAILPSSSAVFNKVKHSKQKIGLIDSSIDNTHPAFSKASITHKSFVPDNLNEPIAHGTAIASILVGNTKGYTGLLPKAELCSASVFYQTPEIQQGASVKSLLMALDWLVESDVKIINMSLAGPQNALLEYAIRDLSQQGVVVIAAAGNEGPTSAPVYPAAYDNVLAVTAVTKDRHAYFKANRGEYIDFSAPGVNIAHALPQNSFGKSSGTSFAVPFVTAAAAYLSQKNSSDRVIELLYQSAIDLGKKGKDEIYGLGLIQLP